MGRGSPRSEQGAKGEACRPPGLCSLQQRLVLATLFCPGAGRGDAAEERSGGTEPWSEEGAGERADRAPGGCQAPSSPTAQREAQEESNLQSWALEMPINTRRASVAAAGDSLARAQRRAGGGAELGR